MQRFFVAITLMIMLSIVILIPTHVSDADFSVGNIELEIKYHKSDNVIVTDPDMNKNSDIFDYLDVKVRLDSDPIGVVISMREIEQSNGIFLGIIHFTSEKSHDNMLNTKLGDDRIYVQYVDYTLPDQYLPQNKWLLQTPVKYHQFYLR